MTLHMYNSVSHFMLNVLIIALIIFGFVSLTFCVLFAVRSCVCVCVCVYVCVSVHVYDMSTRASTLNGWANSVHTNCS